MIETLPIVSRNPQVQTRYEELRQAGESHGIADVLANRQFAGVRTNDTFMRGKRNNNQFGDGPLGQMIGEFYRSKALEAGVNPHGRYYSSSVARFTADPQAWIEGKDDLMRTAREHNMTVIDTVSGRVLHQGYQPDIVEESEYTVAPDIVASKLAEIESSIPDPLRPQEREDLKHSLTESLSGR